MASEDEAEFVRRVRRAGVLARPRYAAGGRERVVGYSVALRPLDGADPVWFGGGRLAADLALPRLRELWEVGLDDPAGVLQEWRGSGATTAGRESEVGSVESWRLATQAVEDTYRRLAAVPLDEVATWAGAARELAGVFAASSARLEGSIPDPLAQAANLLARSAQRAAGTLPPPRHAASKLRGVAVIAAQGKLNRGWRPPHHGFGKSISTKRSGA